MGIRLRLFVSNVKRNDSRCKTSTERKVLIQSTGPSIDCHTEPWLR